MRNLFHKNQIFNENISKWDVRNVTNMGGMFYGASKFNKSLSNWNTNNVTTMSYMFREASSFNQSLSSWNTAQVTAMSLMFASASSFNQSLANWNTARVVDAYCMLQGASSFRQSLHNFSSSQMLTLKPILNESDEEFEEKITLGVEFLMDHPDESNFVIFSLDTRFCAREWIAALQSPYDVVKTGYCNYLKFKERNADFFHNLLCMGFDIIEKSLYGDTVIRYHAILIRL